MLTIVLFVCVRTEKHQNLVIIQNDSLSHYCLYQDLKDTKQNNLTLQFSSRNFGKVLKNTNFNFSCKKKNRILLN